MSKWMPTSPSAVAYDEMISEFWGYKIRVRADGWILGVSISDGAQAWQMADTEHYYNTDWYLHQAIQFIQRQRYTQSLEGDRHA